MQYEQLYPFITSKLEKDLPNDIVYHNVDHTISVIKKATYIAKKEKIDADDLTLLKTAALLHDIGFLENHLNHELLSCQFAQKNLPNFGYTDEQIASICEMIMTTKLPQNPKNELSSILCDADLYYLGGKKYDYLAGLLYKEYKHKQILKTEEEWQKRQLEFLNDHHYFTKTAREEREPLKLKNKLKLEKTLIIPKKSKVIAGIQDFIYIILGVFITAFALKCFLVPNNFFDGGITGLSLLIHEIYKVNLNMVIFLFNLPLIIISYFSVGKRFAIRTFLSIILLGICLWLLPVMDITQDKLIVAVFGGVFLGIGIGLVMRAGAALDGIEVLALYTLKRTSFTITEIVMAINICIFGIAAFRYGIETSLYSILIYFTATRTIDYVVEGIQAFTGVTIISGSSESIKHQLVNEMKRAITIYKGERGFLPGKYDVSADCDIIFTVITRLEMRKLKNLVYKIDPNAFIFANTIRETSGGIIKKRVKH